MAKKRKRKKPTPTRVREEDALAQAMIFSASGEVLGKGIDIGKRNADQLEMLAFKQAMKDPANMETFDAGTATGNKYKPPK